jgi:hypothetical protein
MRKESPGFHAGWTTSARDVFSVFAAARRYSRALDERARHDRNTGAILFLVVTLAALALWCLLTLPHS